MTTLKTGDIIELSITGLGGLGDGIGHYKGDTVFVPFTCAGDTVRAEITTTTKGDIRAKLAGIIRPSERRQIPPCPDFGVCGGCSLQHLNPEDYAAFKKATLSHMLHRLGGSAEVLQELVAIGAGSRRRVEVKIAVNKGEVSLGFFGMKSHDLIDIEECPVTDAGITALFPSLRALVASFKKPGAVKSLHITRVDGGFDMTFQTATRLHPTDRQKIIAFAETSKVLRMSEQNPESQPQTLITRAAVTTTFAGIKVELPAPAFLQATQQGQSAITDFILKHVQGHKRVMDLYSGCGTYSFPLQQAGHQVSAYEGSYDMVTAMHNAIRTNALEGTMSATMRDLFADPVKTSELRNTDAVVINPPRNGAEAQVKQLAQSTIPKIVMVSCNPATFERDAKHLLGNGYTLTHIMPIDQFVWSAHLELVAAFEKR